MMFDFTVIGGGVAGATLANALVFLGAKFQRPLRIALIEARTFGVTHTPLLDARALALSWNTAQTLSRYQLWPDVQPLTIPIRHIVAHAHGGMAQVNLQARDYRLDAFGYVVELHNFQRHMYQRCQDTPEITVFSPDKPIHFHYLEDAVELTLASGQVLQTRLVVGADGQPSWLGQQVGVQWQEKPFNQHAVLCNVELKTPLEGRAYERFAPDGPMALLPLQSNHAAFVWCTTPQIAQNLLQDSSDVFLAKARAAFGAAASPFTAVGSRQLFPLKLLYSTYPLAHRCILIANAAQQLHPVAGQGFNLGIRDIEVLIDSVQWCIQQDIPIGDYQQLRYYWQQRKADQKKMIHMTTSLVDLFSTSSPTLQRAGQLGLGLTRLSRTLEYNIVRPLLGKGYRNAVR